MKPGAQDWGVDPDALRFFDGSGGSCESAALPGDQRSFYRGIAAALRGAAPNPVTPSQILSVMAVIEAARCSARLGASVEPALDANERSAFKSDTAIAQA